MPGNIFLFIICAFSLFIAGCADEGGFILPKTAAEKEKAARISVSRDEEMLKVMLVTIVPGGDIKHKDSTVLAVSDGNIASAANDEEPQFSKDVRTTRNILSVLLYKDPLSMEHLKPVKDADLNKALSVISKLAAVEKVERTDNRIIVTFFMAGEREWEYILE